MLIWSTSTVMFRVVNLLLFVQPTPSLQIQSECKVPKILKFLIKVPVTHCKGFNPVSIIILTTTYQQLECT